MRNRTLLLWGILWPLLMTCHRPAQVVWVQSSEVQLSRPSVRVDQVFFYDSTQVQVGATQKDCQVYYNEEGGPIRPNRAVSGNQLTITESTSLRFQSRGSDFVPSETLQVELFRIKPLKMILKEATAATPPYNKARPEILLDHQKGSKDFRSNAWLGYQDTLVSIDVILSGEPIRGLALSFLEDQASWIFGPAMVEASFFDQAGQLIAQLQERYDAEEEKTGSSFQFIRLITAEIRPHSIQLKIRSLGAIPDWHPGNGNPPWLFIDEIVLL